MADPSTVAELPNFELCQFFSSHLFNLPLPPSSLHARSFPCSHPSPPLFPLFPPPLRSPPLPVNSPRLAPYSTPFRASLSSPRLTFPLSSPSSGPFNPFLFISSPHHPAPPPPPETPRVQIIGSTCTLQLCFFLRGKETPRSGSPQRRPMMQPALSYPRMGSNLSPHPPPHQEGRGG